MKDILDKVYRLIKLHKAGRLGGEVMPEDANPGLAAGDAENYTYFTLPMALNYQRDSYKLWQAADKSYRDGATSEIFAPGTVVKMSDDELRAKLLKYKVALQPNKHVEIWRTISETIVRDFGGDIRRLFVSNDYDAGKIKEYILARKKDFPYLGGPKILNYWLHVMGQYTDARLKNRDSITVAPDTHVIQSSERLGLITAAEAADPNIRDELAARWQKLLTGTGLSPIDVHTPLWLWSRGGFKQEI